MSTTTILAIAIPLLVLAAGVLLFATDFADGLSISTRPIVVMPTARSRDQGKGQ